ncbi:TetR/AcrR family transcriptional regulator [Nonomuraea indica]|uniref:TetR/AcrR family transcriptional regulator n=1 Tax=Nonomuraea indica TaxID=1581193 RepID=UPI000C7ADABB|nr:TetR/AcrR family transcriptional regulator [Nonomuraea indica]
MDATVGLRERKKAETRQAVHEATLRLAVELGLDNVTVEAIADAANISRRTFSNYFDSKEDALLYGDERRLGELVQHVRDQPAQLSAWRALRGALECLFDEDGSPDRDWLIRTKLAKRHPSLLARQLASRVRLETQLTQALAGRAAGGVAAEVITAAFLAGLRVATQRWIADGETRTLREITDQVLDQIAQPFG